MDELNAQGFFTDFIKESPAGRRTSTQEKIIRITLNRAAILGEKPFPSAAGIDNLTADSTADKSVDSIADKTADSIADRLRTKLRTKENHSLSIPLEPKNPKTPPPSTFDWAVVEDCFLALPSDRRPTVWKQAIADARGSGVTPSHVIAIVDHYQRSGPKFNPGALVTRLRSCDPRTDPSDDWPEPIEQSKRPRSATTDEERLRRRLSSIERPVILAGRKNGLNDAQIRELIGKEFDSRGIPRRLIGFASDSKPIST
ncbi:hypothetical protein [Rubripirellula obstinata]|uniref:hypothetical protein n=1 Tax=Rubripirellula obstinata TaxID=406547 RepID=UPI00122CDF5E|nr:hypothetical protein [Rubripirellula obstinata]